MNAAKMREVTANAKEEAQAAAEAKWLDYGIANVERFIQNAAANQLSFYRYTCETRPPGFVVKHFEDLGFEVGVSNSPRALSFDLRISW